MSIIVRLDVMLALRKMTSRELANRIGLSEQNLSVLRSGKARGVRFSTLNAIAATMTPWPSSLVGALPLFRSNNSTLLESSPSANQRPSSLKRITAAPIASPVA